MKTRSVLHAAAIATLIGALALPVACWSPDSPIRASGIPACAQTEGCLAEVVNPNSGRTLGGRVTIANETRLPIIAVMRPDGGLAYLPTVVGQSMLATLTVAPISFTDSLAAVQGTGRYVPWAASRLTVRLDGIPAYAVVPRLRLGFTARFVGQPVVVGEGSFQLAPVNTLIAVAAGGAITLQPPGAAEVAPLLGFVLQVRVLQHWVTVANGRIPASALARFARVPGRTWTCHGPGGGCTAAG